MCVGAQKLHEHILKKYIRDGNIYNIIYKQEEEDHTTYPDGTETCSYATNISKN